MQDGIERTQLDLHEVAACHWRQRERIVQIHILACTSGDTLITWEHGVSLHTARPGTSALNIAAWLVAADTPPVLRFEFCFPRAPLPMPLALARFCWMKFSSSYMSCTW